MKFTVIENATFGELKNLPLKGNLLKNSLPELLDAKLKPVPVRGGNLTNIVGDRAMSDWNHVQLLAELPLTITYEVPSGAFFDKILVATPHFETDYGYGRYEVYLSNNKANLYNNENFLAEYDRRGKWTQEDFCKGTAQIYCMEQPGNFRYLGIKVTHGSVCDGLVRIDFIGLFGEKEDAFDSFTLGLGAELLEHAECITAEKGKIYELKGKNASSALLVKPSEAHYYLWSEGQQVFTGEITCKPVTLLFGKDTYWLYRCDGTADYFGVVGESELPKLFCNTVSVSVETSSVINPDFIGAGTNILPTALMEESLQKGYDPAYWTLEQEAIKAIRPNVARIWFQNDWFQTGPDEYDFESVKMKAFYEYLDVLKETGTEIELDFSFVVGNNIQSWFGFSDVSDLKRSAPRDVEQFARSVVATLKYLWDVKGYDNLKYLTLSNEPEGPNFKVPGDMQDKMNYYAKTLRAVHNVLTAEGLRDKVEIWGPEDSSPANDEWLKAMDELAGDVIDRFTKHSYRATNDELEGERIAKFKNASGNHPVCLTEFGNGIVLWRKSNIGHFIAAANCGLSAILQWALSSAVLPDPLFGLYASEICLWQNIGFKNDKLYLNPICNEYAMLMRYVSRHSAVVKTVCSNMNDIRAAAFTDNSGDITVVVEARDSGIRDIKIELDKLVDRPMYRFSYNLTDCKVPSTLMPEGKEVSFNGKTITDRLCEKHTAIVYTTKKPQPQITLSCRNNVLKAGEEVDITYSTINLDQSVDFSVTSGCATVTPGGVLSVDAKAKSGTIIAVTAASAGENTVEKTMLFKVE